MNLCLYRLELPLFSLLFRKRNSPFLLERLSCYGHLKEIYQGLRVLKFYLYLLILFQFHCFLNILKMQSVKSVPRHPDSKSHAPTNQAALSQSQLLQNSLLMSQIKYQTVQATT